MPHNIRLDKGTETRVLVTIHAYLWKQQNDVYTDEEACDTVIYGPSLYNQASNRRFYKNFKQNLKQKTLHNLFFC